MLARVYLNTDASLDDRSLESPMLGTVLLLFSRPLLIPLHTFPIRRIE